MTPIDAAVAKVRSIADSAVRLGGQSRDAVAGDRVARKALAARLARRFSLSVEPTYHSLARHRATWLRRLDIASVLDVGANTGQWATELRANGYTGKLMSFEPQARAFAALSTKAALDPDWRVQRCALGAASGSIELKVTVDSLSSSILPPARNTYDFMDLRDPEVVPLRMLAEFQEETRDRATYLKLDVQGYELEVLRGGGPLLHDCAAVECELSLTQLYEGQPLIEDVVTFLRHAGFTPVTFTRGYTDPTSHQVVQVDGIFVRQSLLPA